MATLTVRKLNYGTYTPGTIPKYSGLDVAVAGLDAAAATDQFLNDGRTFLYVNNTGGTIDTVTITAQKASDQGILTHVVVDVPITTGRRLIGPFDAAQFNDVNGYVQVAHSYITSVVQAAISLQERGRG